MSKTKHILLVEDEEHLANTIKLNLELENYIVDSASSGAEALKKFQNNKFQLIVLDVMLPEVNGFDVCSEIRKTNKNIPILFLTAKGNSEDRIKGLKLGADDYLTKPFNLEELLLRVQILLKRTDENTSSDSSIGNVFKFGKNEIYFSTFEIIGTDKSTIQISKKEIDLLKLLIERKGEVVSREDILDIVWGKDAFPTSRTIDNYILAFRKYFEENPKEPSYFHSIRGVGYKFTP